MNAAGPFGMKKAAKRPPKRLASTQDVVDVQRFMMHALVRPLTPDDRMQDTWTDGRPMAEVAGEFIKPNDRLDSFERLEIYSRMYWFRLLENIQRDCPALRALLGEDKFTTLSQAYLSRYPSRSFTLRNLCERLPRFIEEKPELTAPDTALALQVARFEWAQTVAFDGPELPKPGPKDLSVPPSRLKLKLQPFVSLLHLTHALDNFAIAVAKRDSLRGEASNAPVEMSEVPRIGKVRRPKAGELFLAVHRQDNRLYYKRLEAPAYAILQALSQGRPLAKAIQAGGPKVKPKDIERWFATWMKLGWFARVK